MKINQIRVGTILSYLSMGLSTLVSLAYTPIMIERLGHSEYGVYQLVLPIVSYLDMMSFGLGSAYVRYYSQAKVAGDRRAMAKLNGMFLLTFTGLGLLVLAVGFTLSMNGEVVFGSKLTAEEIALGERLLRVMTVNAAVALPISVFESNVTIHEQYLFQKLVLMVRKVLNPLLMIPLLLIGYRSMALTVLTLAFTLLSGVMNIFYCLTRLKMPFNLRRYDFRLMGEMAGFTSYVFIGIVVDNFNWSIGRLLLGWLQGTEAVTIYVVAAQLNTYYMSFATAVSNVLTPRVHRLVAEGRPTRELDALLTKAGRLQFLLLACIFWGFVAIGQPFVVLWGGGQEFAVDYYTALLLMFATIWPNVQTVGTQIQFARGMHKFRSLVYGGVAIGTTVLSIPLILQWSGLGAAIGTTVATFVGNVLLMNWYYYRRMGLNIPKFWRHIFHLLPAMVPPAIVSVLLAVYVHPTGYFGLVLPGCLIVAVYSGSLWLFGMNRYERGLVSAPLRRLLRRR